MDLIAYRRERRRQRNIEYARSYRRTKAEAKAPDSRAIAAALLSLMLDSYAASGRVGAPTELLDRLERDGYDRHASADEVAGLVERHCSMLTLSREAIGCRKSA